MVILNLERIVNYLSVLLHLVHQGESDVYPLQSPIQSLWVVFLLLSDRVLARFTRLATEAWMAAPGPTGSHHEKTLRSIALDDYRRCVRRIENQVSEGEKRSEQVRTSMY